MSFKEKLEQLADKELLDYYGTWDQPSSERAKLSLTGGDEYVAIRQSLYILLAVLKYQTADEILEFLAQPFKEEDFTFDGLIPDSEQQKKALTNNVASIIKLRDILRNTWKEKGNEKLIHTFLLHDLCKQKAFLNQYKIADPNQYSAISHDHFLQLWLSNHSDEKEDFKASEKWVDLFDGLGHNPKKLLSTDYVGVLTIVNNTLDYLQALHADTNSINKEDNVQALNFFLYNKIKNLDLDIRGFEFLIADNTKRKPWGELPEKQQQQSIMLILCCPLIFVKTLDPNQATTEFIKEWNNLANKAIVDQMTQFMIRNMSSKDPVWLYNITGTLHHPPERGGSHFAQGGTVKELFSVFFPFVLKIVNGSINGIKIEKQPCFFNKYQVLQGIEMHFDILYYLLFNVSINWRAINFASPEIKALYINELKEAKEYKIKSELYLPSQDHLTTSGSPVFSRQGTSPSQKEEAPQKRLSS